MDERKRGGREERKERGKEEESAFLSSYKCIYSCLTYMDYE